MCLELKEHIARENSYTITVGIGNTVSEIALIKTSYQQAVLALEQKLIIGKNSVIRICDIQENNDKSFSNKDFIESVIKNIRELDMDGAIQSINHMTDLIISEKVGSKSLHKFFYSLLNIITYTISDMGVNTELVFSPSSDLIDDFLQNEDVEDIKKWFFNIFKSLEQAIALKESNAPNDIINRVKEYIHTNYMSDISLSNIADIVYLHPHYLGKLFKKYEGITINEYLTCIRMERAKELLIGGNVKIADISQIVGISSPQYFIHCFKSYQGVTPKNFRDMNRA
jgi:two-component system response regulator YesN